MELYHGNIVYSESREKLVTHQDSYIAIEVTARIEKKLLEVANY